MLVLTTCGGEAEADALAARLVGAQQAACVNRIDNVSSTFRWGGDIETGRETLLLIKTTEDRVAAVERTIRELSSYELPEVIAVRVERGSEAYLRWIADSTTERT